MPGVGGARTAERPVAVDGDAVEAEVLHPEPGLDPLAHGLGPLIPDLGARPPQTAQHERHGAEGGERVALHLRQRHRPLGKAAVLVEDRVNAVLPALVGKAGGGPAGIVDQAVLIGVAVALDPFGRRADGRPEPVDQRDIAGALQIGAGEGHVERRGVHAAVVEPERDLLDRRHLAATRLVHDLARI